MKTVLAFLALVSACGLALADERTIVVPIGDKPFTVGKDDHVRLTGKGIAGSKVTIKVVGPAKIETTSNVRELVDGQVVIGNTVMEYNLKPNGLGKVTVTITVAPPQPDAAAKITKYEFEVK